MRKKLFVRVLCGLFIILMFGSAFCACSKSTGSSEEDKVRTAVEAQGFVEGIGITIGGKEIKSSLTKTSVTTLEKVSSTKYKAYGRITMTDVYGTNWNNQFTCTVTCDADDWDASSFEYLNQSWSKN